MATVTFFIRKNKNPASIYVRLRAGRKIDITVKTDKTINPKFWNNNWIRKAAAFGDKLNLENDLQSLILRRRNDTITVGSLISSDWLQNVIHEWQGVSQEDSSTYLVNLIKEYIKTMPNRLRNGKVGLSNGTYKTTIGRLIKFQENTRHKYLLKEIDLKFKTALFDYLKNDLGLALNSISKDISNIKAVCREAEERGLKVNRQVYSKSFSSPAEKILFTTLNPGELELISKYSGKQYLENARDWLIISCWTGCRVGDLMKLSMGNIKLFSDDKRVIQYTQSKTKKMVNIPRHDQVSGIIDRLGGFPRAISVPKYNKYLKELCESAGLNEIIEGSRQNPITKKKETGTFEKWKLISSHVGRRSFATNQYNLPTNKAIMAVTGHSTEKQLLAYIGEVESDHLESFFDFWDKEVLLQKLETFAD